ncbi:hypothetical protein JKF63_07977 [Porcisia hertigi]|uniref:Uncharacterized protein n=1 Tax=Porcisia hertigi TaxID=2761500 RepID=A0A836L5U2_9TRYP|nr:hypothetical protein JKF63_07977 [Porcisia hertigi]
MSFFANPLAEEEEEVVPPDYPLEQYDELKREDDFNELLVRSTKLEREQSSSVDGMPSHPELETCLRHTRELRASLESGWLRMSRLQMETTREAPFPHIAEKPSWSTSVPSFIRTLNSAVTQLQCHVTQRERLGQHLRGLLEREAAEFFSSTPHPVTGTACTDNASSLARPPQMMAPLTVSEMVAERASGAVRALEGLLPSMSTEEAALASAAAQQLCYGLQSWSMLTHRCGILRTTVALKSQEQAEAHRAAEAFARWAAQRKLSWDKAAASPAPSSAAVSSSFDTATAELLNKELCEENGRLEALLARLIATQQLDGAACDAFAGSAVVQYNALIVYAQELEAEVNRLGRAVLYLRCILADPSSSEAWSAPSATDAGAASGQRPTNESNERLAMHLNRIQAVEKELQSQQAASNGAASASDVVNRILRLGLSRLLELHDSCLHGLALLSTYFQKQSGTAAFVSHAMRGGGVVEDATMERVLDVQLPDAKLMRQCCPRPHVLSLEFDAKLKGIVEASITAGNVYLARWQAVRRLLVELVQSALATAPEVYAEFSAPLEAYAESKTPSATAAASALVANKIHVHLDCSTAALAEEAKAFADEKAAQREEIMAFWAAQQAEVKKKMAWLTKQPNAPLLTQLCEVEERNEQLRHQLECLQEASEDTSVLQKALQDLQKRIHEEEQHNATLQGELEGLEIARRELETQRDDLLSTM